MAAQEVDDGGEQLAAGAERPPRVGHASSRPRSNASWLHGANERRCRTLGPCTAERGQVLGRAVPDVALEAVLRVALGEPHHQAVARDLGDDGGGRDRRRLLVAVDDVAVLARHRQPEAVGDQRRVVRRIELLERPRQGVQVGAVDVPGVDLGHRHHDQRDAQGAAQDRRQQRVARQRRAPLRVVEPRQRTALRERERIGLEQHSRPPPAGRPGRPAPPRRCPPRTGCRAPDRAGAACAAAARTLVGRRRPWRRAYRRRRRRGTRGVSRHRTAIRLGGHSVAMIRPARAPFGTGP